MDIPGLELSVSEFVGLLNQTLEFAYPSVIITGELANLRVSKGRWLYFDLKDELSTVKFFGTVYMLPGPLEDGMMVRVRGTPRLHNVYGFSVNVMNIQPAGEGSIKKAAELLAAKLEAEGLFDADRKRQLPYPPERIGLITSAQSAAFADFVKILNARWGGMDVSLIDVQVQGEAAVEQIVRAVEQFNGLSEPPDVLVLVRGGGSAEDLAAFSTEQVTRAVAASRVPTLVAIGHEVDVSLAELAADVRASTPSNAAELLTPDKKHVATTLGDNRKQLHANLMQIIATARSELKHSGLQLTQVASSLVKHQRAHLESRLELLSVLSPASVLARGYAIVRVGNKTVRKLKDVKLKDAVSIELEAGTLGASITSIDPKK